MICGFVTNLYTGLLFCAEKSLLLFCSADGAQPAGLGNWMIYFGNYQINEKWNLHHEVQWRNYNMAGDLEQLLLRTGLGYNLRPIATCSWVMAT